MQRSTLEDFLDQQMTGGVKDSSGRFTLSRDKALEKLAHFQLPRETSWALKIVQAAVASEARALSIRQTVQDTQFEFSPQNT